MVTPDGTWLQSRHRHDYVEYTDANGMVYMVDGGLDYARRSINDSAPHTDKCVYDDSPHEEQREAATWGTYGKNGDEPRSCITIANMDKAHIEAVLESEPQARDSFRNLMMAELEYRKSL